MSCFPDTEISLYSIFHYYLNLKKKLGNPASLSNFVKSLRRPMLNLCKGRWNNRSRDVTKKSSKVRTFQCRFGHSTLHWLSNVMLDQCMETSGGCLTVTISIHVYHHWQELREMAIVNRSALHVNEWSRLEGCFWKAPETQIRYKVLNEETTFFNWHTHVYIQSYLLNGYICHAGPWTQMCKRIACSSKKRCCSRINKFYHFWISCPRC